MTSLEQAREAIRWCRQLAKLSEDRNATTRTFLSKPMRDVHTALAAWMARAGMTVRVDAIGNIRGVYPPVLSPVPLAAAPRFYIGSHLDTVPNAGAFDGVLGTVLAIALVELLGEKRFPFAIEVIGFSDEEGVRFSEPFLGSRALAGTFDMALLDRTDESGRSLRDAIRQFGLEPNRIPDAKAPANALGYLEFHIEQGPVLENLNLPLAVVDVISGQTRAELTFTGAAGHAGTTPMKMRKDALACAAAWMTEVEREALTTSGLVATVGRIAVEPDAGNVVPGRAVVSLDVRHPADRTRKTSAERLFKAADDIAAHRGVQMTCEPRLDQPSVAMDPGFAAMLDRALERSGAPAHRMSSGAGHDAMIVAPKMPAGMLFLRCEGGVSHHPAENVRDDDVAAALDAGRKFLDELELAHRG
ncbi:MAG TPA: allantoate amidohydrolase [Vicinamibacterales bacterium]|nr:allantoate amidohydrolase [Vicinamibacterales bacterium]